MDGYESESELTSLSTRIRAATHLFPSHAPAAVSTGGDRGLLFTSPNLANHLLCAGKGTHTSIRGSLV